MFISIRILWDIYQRYLSNITPEKKKNETKLIVMLLLVKIMMKLTFSIQKTLGTHWQKLSLTVDRNLWIFFLKQFSFRKLVFSNQLNSFVHSSTDASFLTNLLFLISSSSFLLWHEEKKEYIAFLKAHPSLYTLIKHWRWLDEYGRNIFTFNKRHIERGKIEVY